MGSGVCTDAGSFGSALNKKARRAGSMGKCLRRCGYLLCAADLTELGMGPVVQRYAKYRSTGLPSEPVRAKVDACNWLLCC